MDQSTAKMNNLEIRRYGFYSYMRNLESALAFIVLETTDKEVKGLRVRLGKIEHASIPKESFETMLAYNMLEFVELLPKTVWKKLKKDAK